MHRNPDAESGVSNHAPERLRQALLRTFSGQGAARPDLSLRDLAVLLGIGPGVIPQSLDALAARTGLPRTQIGRAVQALMRAGLTAREMDPAHPRKILVRAAPGGLRILQAMAAAPPDVASPARSAVPAAREISAGTVLPVAFC